LIEQHSLRAAIFLGDDQTDTDAFAVLHELRSAGCCATLNVGVNDLETPSSVREQADLLVEGVHGVERLLARMVALTAATQQ
jgi:trehalose-6-phosphatase